MAFSKNALHLDAEKETRRMVDFIKDTILSAFNRQGAVIGISGGIDSSVVAALCVRALGPDRVLGILMPEKESSPDSREIAERLAARLGIDHRVEDITAVLESMETYGKRDEAVKRVFPGYDPPADKVKIVLPGDLLERESLNVFSATVVKPDGTSETRRLPVKDFLQIVAASNTKQRTRMMTLYYHAEKRNYAVVGTANKNEYDQGFFVKYGDGGIDLQPIAHLFKTQIFQLGAHLDLPKEILDRTPTTDTYSAEATQTEFFFRLPFDLLDLLWYAMEQDVPLEEAASAAGLTEEQVERIYRDIRRKKQTTAYLRCRPLSPEG
jgi:NAD+ synthase